MRVTIRDTEALKAVSPAALSAYARAAGWSKAETYRDHSDVYVAHGRPEIILPRTEHLGDYADVVSRLVETFANAMETDELSLYRDLVTADRDVIRSGRTGIAGNRLTGETRVPIFASLPVSGGRHRHDSRLSPA